MRSHQSYQTFCVEQCVSEIGPTSHHTVGNRANFVTRVSEIGPTLSPECRTAPRCHTVAALQGINVSQGAIWAQRSKCAFLREAQWSMKRDTCIGPEGINTLVFICFAKRSATSNLTLFNGTNYIRWNEPANIFKKIHVAPCFTERKKNALRKPTRPYIWGSVIVVYRLILTNM